MKWENIALHQIIKVHYGKALKADNRDGSGSIPVYGSSGQVGCHTEFLIDYPTLIIGRKGSVGEIIYAEQGGWPIDTVFYTQLLSPDKVDLRYLFYALKQANLARWTITTSIPGLNRNDLYSTQIPLPPIAEQRRIAAILDKADGVRRKRKEAISLTEELLRSVFLNMFGDPVTNPKGWEVAQLGDFGDVITGNTPPRSDPDNYGDEIEWIKSDNITTPEHFLTEAEERLSSKGKKKARIVPAGSVLVTCIAGSKSSIGRAAIADREVAFNQQINAVIPASDVDPYFLYSHFFIAQHLVQAKSTDSMKGLVSKSKFSSVDFIKPPKEKQQEFGKWFLKFFKYYENLSRGEQDSSDFFNSLLQRAFRGEL